MVLLLFYLVDFGYIRPVKLVSLQNMLEELETNNCVVRAISSRSVVSKVACLSMSTHKYEGGLEGVKIGIVEDIEGLIVRSLEQRLLLQVHGTAGHGRAGVVVARMVMDLPIGLVVMKALRQIKATNDQERGQE